MIIIIILRVLSGDPTGYGAATSRVFAIYENFPGSMSGFSSEDVKHDTREAEDVLDVAVAIAEADGEIEPEERKVLEEIAGVLGLRLENRSPPCTVRSISQSTTRGDCSDLTDSFRLSS